MRVGVEPADPCCLLVNDRPVALFERGVELVEGRSYLDLVLLRPCLRDPRAERFRLLPLTEQRGHLVAQRDGGVVVTAGDVVLDRTSQHVKLAVAEQNAFGVVREHRVVAELIDRASQLRSISVTPADADEKERQRRRRADKDEPHGTDDDQSHLRVADAEQEHGPRQRRRDGVEDGEEYQQAFW